MRLACEEPTCRFSQLHCPELLCPAQLDGLFELALTPPLLQPNMSHHPCTLFAASQPSSLLYGTRASTCNLSMLTCQSSLVTEQTLQNPTQTTERYGQEPFHVQAGPVPAQYVAPIPWSVARQGPATRTLFAGPNTLFCLERSPLPLICLCFAACLTSFAP